MPFALFSDIHANLEALETAESFAKKRGLTRFIVLGDTVGYGANPNECFEWALKNAETVLMGNHEKAVTDIGLREFFAPIAAEAIAWTASVMDPKLIKQTLDLIYKKVEKTMTFTHSSPDEPEKFRYIRNLSDAKPSFENMENNLCFIGHTHVPSCFFEKTNAAETLKPGILRVPKNEKVILNPGSVGQPRDRDPRLSFGIFDEAAWTFEIVRLEYDAQKAARKIRKAGLPAYLADRLL